MKRWVTAAFLAAALLAGCSGSPPGDRPSAAGGTVLTKGAENEPPVPAREETVWLDAATGWRAVYYTEGMSREDMELYATQDGGDSWSEVANSLEADSSLPGGMKSGFMFVNEQEGWMTANAPWQGKVGLYKTSDGGAAWSEQPLAVPDELQSAQIFAVPPLFFTQDKGILATRPIDEGHSLVYVTGDGGQSWQPYLDGVEAEELGIEWSFDGRMAIVEHEGGKWSVVMEDGGKWLKL